jgi:hypothetical protein
MLRISCVLSAAFLFFAANASAQCFNGVCSSNARSFSIVVQPAIATHTVHGIQLAPGEVLIAVDGIPVEHVIKRDVGPLRAIASGLSTLVDKFVVNRSERAYQHALRAAQILAARGTAGHPLGVAPGCRYSGTGISFSADRPNHCYLGLPNSRLVARAVVQGTDGRFYWSAHYR